MTLSDYGSWASLIGLVITFITSLMVYKIRGQLTLRHSTLDSLRSLKEHAIRLTEHSSAYADKIKEIKNALALAKVDLKIPREVNDSELKQEIQSAVEKIDKFILDLSQSEPRPDVSRLWEVITSINVVIAVMDKNQRTQYVRGT